MTVEFSEFKAMAEHHTAIPVYRRLMADILTPVSLFLNIRQNARMPFLLESVEGGEQLARYSFSGRDPWQVLRFDGGKVTLEREGETEELEESYFDALERLTSRYSEPEIGGLPRLTGGAVGYSSYDTVREIERLGDPPGDGLGLPDAVWAFYNEIYAFDHVKQQVVLVKTVLLDGEEDDLRGRYDLAVGRLDAMEKRVYGGERQESRFTLSPGNIRSNLTRERFGEMVEAARDHIREGDIFQVVLSQRFETDFSGDTFMLYRALRMVNPSPYLFYLDFGDFALAGSSPEVLVRVQDREVELLPIAGTRPRGKTPQEDRALEEDLLADPKENAEHVMLVDLGRNDLSRVCDPGTVRPVRSREIERYSHVMHIVSDLRGTLAEGRSPVDALKCCFPAGTVSGAPKIRAMEIIDDLEPSGRGPYAGAVGYFDFSGNMDTCIAIRTMVITGNRVYIQAGAGIVADSRADAEYEETRNKAGALVEALSVALSMTKNND